jgi:2-dehydro-3-deoxyphosphogluconate aldolase/(4S)-4-hydroxy-2-oxoglutarate aldolase
MKNKHDIIGRIISQGLLPLFYHENKDVSIEITTALYRAGIRVIEYTNRGAHAVNNFAVLKELQEKELPDMILGIGTIRSSNEANDFINAGADFLVAPVVNPEVADIAARNNLLWIPGCMTPTEIYTAYKYGATLVKIFPANVLGPDFISAIKEIFPEVSFMATGIGDLTKQNLMDWFKAGVSAVGLGSKLITPGKMDNGDFEGIYLKTLEVVNLIKSAKC